MLHKSQPMFYLRMLQGPLESKALALKPISIASCWCAPTSSPSFPGTPKTQHESLDEDTGAGAGIGDLLFEEEGEDNREIAEEDVVDKREIVEGDGGAKVEDGGRPNPEEEAAKSFEPLEFSDAYWPSRSRKSTEVLRALQEKKRREDVGARLCGRVHCRLYIR